jgi:hypothetical protein
VFPQSLLENLVGVEGGLGEFAIDVLAKRARHGSLPPGRETVTLATDVAIGANLVGYAFGEFGRGEDVRMVARSLDRMRVPFCIVNQDPGSHGTRDSSTRGWVTSEPRFGTNIFLINADLFPFLPCKLGPRFALGRYNIGYWAWELSEWPAEFALALDMVDEVWAISSFVADSVKTRANVPVVTMPNAVTVPELGPEFNKLRYGLPPASFVFYFIFDAASHIDRKNPIAVVRAFKLAFQDEPSACVHLLIKP